MGIVNNHFKGLALVNHSHSSFYGNKFFCTGSKGFKRSTCCSVNGKKGGHNVVGVKGSGERCLKVSVKDDPNMEEVLSTIENMISSKENP